MRGEAEGRGSHRAGRRVHASLASLHVPEESDGSFVAVASRKREAHIEPASSSESRDWGSTSMTSTRSSLRRSNQRGAGQIEQAWCKAKVFSETTRFYDEDYNPEESWFQRLLRWAQVADCVRKLSLA